MIRQSISKALLIVYIACVIIFGDDMEYQINEAEIVGPGSEDERTEVLYVSPDCKWIITTRWSNFQNVITTTLFAEKEKIREEVYDGIDESLQSLSSKTD